MNARELLVAILDGKKIRREVWSRNQYIQLDARTDIFYDECGKIYKDLRAWLNSNSPDYVIHKPLTVADIALGVNFKYEGKVFIRGVICQDYITCWDIACSLTRSFCKNEEVERCV